MYVQSATNLGLNLEPDINGIQKRIFCAYSNETMAHTATRPWCIDSEFKFDTHRHSDTDSHMTDRAKPNERSEADIIPYGVCATVPTTTHLT